MLRTQSKVSKEVTWSIWNLLITVGVQSSTSNVLDPVLDLGNPSIDSKAWTLTAVAHNTNLGESNNNKKFIKCIKVIRFNL